jgi:hypothetical protein
MVHFMHHSHIDAGWMTDLDNIYNNDGRNIISSVTEALYNDPKLKFNFADIIFLDRWFNE